MTKFVGRQELFMKQLNVHGSIVELGVGQGAGLFTWAQLSAIFEPANYNREVIGFDSFTGFPTISEQDRVHPDNGSSPKRGGFAPRFGSKEQLEAISRVHDLTRFLGHMPKVRLIEGDIATSVPEFLNKNRHLIISLLNIDVDLYAPTISALDHLLPRIPKGGIVIFDELNVRNFPGETIAICERLGLSNVRLRRLAHVPCLSYIVIE